jgi:diaminohydroxyphosphoribosylaminopyrimidine deaminase/5-amino-6-(5-phosphoribosylamino)uracil reductase
MDRALTEARRGLGRTSPNPAVGAVLVGGGELLAVGFHAKAGTDHAEVAALRQVGFRAEGATLYSTLEPCNHHGRTGPCTEAILKAGIRRVVVGALDPNPKVSGAGVRRLRRGGVEVTTGVLEGPCRDLNEAYNHAIVHRSPFVVLKLAVSLDGRVATRAGDAQWITSEAARARGRALRDELDAIVVGVGTVLADDPLLTTRLPGGRDPLRVILDSTLRTPLDAQVVRTARATPTLILTTRAADPARRRALEGAGVTVAPLKKTRAGRVDPEAALRALAERELNGVLVEGGPSVAGAFVDARLVHKVVAFVAPVLIGGEGARSAVGGLGVRRLGDALRLVAPVVESVGGDVCISGRIE